MELQKDDAKVLKGIAIIGMMMLHFWAHPEWVLPGIWWNSFINPEVYMKIGQFGNVCVSIFAFLTGYSFYVASNKWNELKYRKEKIISFLLTYWVYEIIFYFIGGMFRINLPDLKFFILNSFGLENSINSEYVSVPFAWYVSFYISVILLYPLIKKLMNYKWNIVIIGMTYIICKILSQLTADILGVGYFFSREGVIVIVMIGYVFAKYKLITKIIRFKQQYMLSYLFAYFFIAAVWVFKYDWLLDLWGVIYTIIIILFIKNEFFDNTKIRTVLKILGKYSMGMWFISGIFFMPDKHIQNIAFFMGNPILILVWVLMITFVFSYVVDKTMKKLKIW